MRIDSDVLVKYRESFVGFGSYEADFWFIGMEQGGGSGLEELSQRLEAWTALGAGEVLDLKQYVYAMKELRWHGPNAVIQPTLGKLIRIVLATRAITASPATIRSYQVGRFGRWGDETLIAELFPLPSQSVSHWIYESLSAELYLRDRRSYTAYLSPRREELLRQRIEQYRPRVVIFVGWSYMAEWSRLIGRPLKVDKSVGIAAADFGPTHAVVIRHPTSFGVTNKYFEQVGESLAACL